MNIPLYFQCRDCGQIEVQQAWEKLSKDRYKCHFCHKSREQSLWPHPELRHLLTFISEFDEKSPAFPQVSCVFVSSAVELFLEGLLSLMAYEDNLYDEVGHLVELLLETYQGRQRMLALYSKIGHHTFHEEVKHIGKQQFLENWDIIVSARNSVVHGNISECTNITPALIKQTIIDALEVFANLHNEYNKESLHYRVATNPPELNKKEILDELDL